jgi:ribosomal protein S6--L-glutamate ligase
VTLGIGVHPFAPRASSALLSAAEQLGLDTRRIDLPTLRMALPGDGTVRCADAEGEVTVSALAPALLYWQAAAADAYLALEGAGVRSLNPLAACEVADDKARTAACLAAAGVPQVATWVAPNDADVCGPLARAVGYPLLVKRTHGAQGRWVRLVEDDAQLAAALGEFAEEGRGAVVLQRFVAEVRGRSLRVICTAGRVLAATQRRAADGDLRSNIGSGGSQRAVHLAEGEADMALAATGALGLGHAAVDLLRTADGSKVLEVNAFPDFTSMRPHVDVDIAAAVVRACLADDAGR